MAGGPSAFNILDYVVFNLPLGQEYARERPVVEGRAKTKTLHCLRTSCHNKKRAPVLLRKPPVSRPKALKLHDIRRMLKSLS